MLVIVQFLMSFDRRLSWYEVHNTRTVATEHLTYLYFCCFGMDQGQCGGVLRFKNLIYRLSGRRVSSSLIALATHTLLQCIEIHILLRFLKENFIAQLIANHQWSWGFCIVFVRSFLSQMLVLYRGFVHHCMVCVCHIYLFRGECPHIICKEGRAPKQHI